MGNTHSTTATAIFTTTAAGTTVTSIPPAVTTTQVATQTTVSSQTATVTTARSTTVTEEHTTTAPGPTTTVQNSPVPSAGGSNPQTTATPDQASVESSDTSAAGSDSGSSSDDSNVSTQSEIVTGEFLATTDTVSGTNTKTVSSVIFSQNIVTTTDKNGHTIVTTTPLRTTAVMASTLPNGQLTTVTAIGANPSNGSGNSSNTGGGETTAAGSSGFFSNKSAVAGVIGAIAFLVLALGVGFCILLRRRRRSTGGRERIISWPAPPGTPTYRDEPAMVEAASFAPVTVPRQASSDSPFSDEHVVAERVLSATGEWRISADPFRDDHAVVVASPPLPPRSELRSPPPQRLSSAGPETRLLPSARSVTPEARSRSPRRFSSMGDAATARVERHGRDSGFGSMDSSTEALAKRYTMMPEPEAAPAAPPRGDHSEMGSPVLPPDSPVLPWSFPRGDVAGAASLSTILDPRPKSGSRFTEHITEHVAVEHAAPDGYFKDF